MTLRIPKVEILDDLLVPEDAATVVEMARSQVYEDYQGFFSFFRPDISTGYRIFKQRQPFDSRSKSENPLLQLPTSTSIDKIVAKSLAALDIPVSAHVSCSFVLMPNGAQHALHIDTGHDAAFIYYLDSEWGLQNGGELVVYPSLEVSHADFNAALLGRKLPQERFKTAIGYTIAPIFNRLVVFRTGLAHRVNRVEGYIGAGRLALTGFISD